MEIQAYARSQGQGRPLPHHKAVHNLVRPWTLETGRLRDFLSLEHHHILPRSGEDHALFDPAFQEEGDVLLDGLGGVQVGDRCIQIDKYPETVFGIDGKRSSRPRSKPHAVDVDGKRRGSPSAQCCAGDVKGLLVGIENLEGISVRALSGNDRIQVERVVRKHQLVVRCSRKRFFAKAGSQRQEQEGEDKGGKGFQCRKIKKEIRQKCRRESKKIPADIG